MCDILLSRPPATKRVIKSRQLRAIDSDAFREEVVGSLSNNNLDDVNEKVQSFNNNLSNLLDKHAPLTTREVSLRPQAPLYTESVRASKRAKRQLERKWQKSKLTVDEDTFRNQCRQYKKDLDNAKTEYHCAQISACDTRQMFKLVNQLSVHKPSKALPSHNSKKNLANRFSEYFDQKIRNIRVALDVSTSAVNIERETTSYQGTDSHSWTYVGSSDHPRDPQDSVSSVSVKRDLPSDHYAVMCDILLSRPPATKRVIKSRQLRAIDSDVFREEVVGSLSNNNLDDVNEKVQSFNNNLSNLLDKHAPLTTREVSLRPQAPWYTESVRASKRAKRQLERKWQKSKLTVDEDAFRNQCRQYKKDLDNAKTEYHCAQISACDTRLLKGSTCDSFTEKPSLDVDDFKNFRPVSNLPFLWKVIERAAINQLQSYIKDNDLHTKNQSAYRQFHSVETSLLRVTNDLLRAVDDHGEAVLVLLDLSAAFDTVDHNILLTRLSARYGVTGTAHRWFATYLMNRQQSVSIDTEVSNPTRLDWGVPQGSVVGPELFVIYSSPIQDIIDNHGLASISYADDTQLYVVIKPSNRASALAKLEKCIEDIRKWMAANKLMLNDTKTELLHVTSRFSKRVSNVDITIGTSSITPSEEVRNLGVILDSSLTMSSHVNNICRNASYAIHRIGKLRRYLDAANTEKLVHAFITSRLDNCNSILYGLPDKDLNKLQRIQNAAARLVILSKKRDHITPVMFQLHWLPIRQRIIFKLLLLTYKALNEQSPSYISELVHSYHPPRTLRSSSQYLLQESAWKTKTYGRSFSRVAPVLWNNLPLALRSPQTVSQFKSRLKTHLFSHAYDS
ncbi:uncharacterized protein [Amphiura filiformis]|uniref:uncharacterized protein n=1 Tax=Amphiura filiformis TaxID=82378 RepID=UPI003B21EC7B